MSLREEINEVLDIFDEFGISEEKQLYIMQNGGVYFNFAYGTDRHGVNRKFDCLKFARFLKFCKCAGIEINASDLVYTSSYDEYMMDLVHSFDKIDQVQEKKRKKIK